MQTRHLGNCDLEIIPIVPCAECNVVSDSPNDTCPVCGSRSLFNIARMFGGNLLEKRATRIGTHIQEPQIPELVLRPRR
jgi:hypothetical protein